MSGKYPPIRHKDAVRGLKALGFVQRQNKATSHTQWVKESPGELRRKVTLDQHNSPYSGKLLSYIIRQAGVTKDEFYAACQK